LLSTPFSGFAVVDLTLVPIGFLLRQSINGAPSGGHSIPMIAQGQDLSLAYLVGSQYLAWEFKPTIGATCGTI
jgi:hypothetical protein